jgi:hypothetical protein
MPRESNIPLFLWIATAVLAHLMWGGGADRASNLIQERLDIKRFAVNVKRHVRLTNKPIEVAILDDTTKPAPPPPAAEEEEPENPPEDEKDEEKEKDRKADHRAPEEKEKKKDPKKQEPEPEKPKQELVVKKEKKPEETPAEQKELPKLDDRRIAVRQHVKDPKQKDNPNAEFIGDEANKVAEQTQARITSTDQNDPDPTPGGAHAGPAPNPGNADETRVAQSEDREGEADRAPNEGSTTSAEKVAKATPQPKSGDPTAAPRSEAQARPTPNLRSGDPQAPRPATQPPDPGQTARPAVPGAEAMPETMTSDQGSTTIPGQQERVAAQRARRAKRKRLPPPPRSRNAGDLLGLGALGTTENGVNLNLTPQNALAAVGRDRLRKELKADAERRRSAHRGSWKTLGIERWRSAIENYVPSVKPGNQTALNTARVPFASYLNTIHNRLHPIFADSFLASLDSLPAGHPMNRPQISTNLEIVLDQAEGRIVRMGITKTSGVTAFDIAALESVNRAQPFGPPPREIVSPDGNVYFHWEFWREPYFACSTYFARPYILKVKPKSAPPAIEPPPAPPGDPSESPEGDQHGSLKKRQLEIHAAVR